ncbi:MAG: hypothetical protein JRF63_14680 [Deltaproteobacteria bacterium]|nr:hypothetical protein [Deltaproteobacteria bacterium]
MGNMRTASCLAVLLLVGCGTEGPSGPALEPRPEVQTCLPDVSAGMPALLSDTGCFTDLKTLEPGPDLIPYDVNSSLWTDGAFKPRYLVVPSPEQISIEEDGSWVFPEGSVLIKMFGFEFDAGDRGSRRVVETRFMVRRDGRWDYSTYELNEEGTEGELLETRKTVEYTLLQDGQPRVIEYLFPEEDDCITCHGAAINDVLGPKTGQLNRDRDYDGVLANQLVAMAEIDLLALDVAEEIDPAAEPRMANPQKGEGTLGERARAYLDANCAHCHRPDGYANSGDHGLDLRYQVPLEETGICDPMKYFEWAGVPRLAPGNPEGSGILQRFLLLDELQMPSIGRSTIDPFGTSLLRDWIIQLDSCP